MSCEWISALVSDLEREGALLVQDGNHGESRPRRDEIVPSGTPHIRAADITDGEIDFAGSQHINRVALGRIRKGVGAPGDVLLTHKGTVGRVARVPDNAPHFVCSPQTTFWRSLDSGRVDQAFLFAYMRSPYFAAQLKARMHESDMAPYVSLTAQRALVVLLPPIDVQRAIARVISVLDDKIRSNRRLGVLLEKTVQTLFGHYVLGAGGDPSWEVGGLPTVARFVNGRAFTKDANGEGRPILRIKELNGGLSGATLYSDIEADDDNIARHDDMLFSWSGSLDLYRWHGPEALINQHIFKVLPVDGFPSWFVAGWVRHHMREFQRIARDKATTMGHIKREHLTQAAVRIPLPRQIAELDQVIAPLEATVSSLARETIRLTDLRDLLLPKLVMGEIAVADPEETSRAGPLIEGLVA